jgi:Flp pilus assembly protein TadG
MTRTTARRDPGERGSVTVEFAVALPVVAVVLASGIAGVVVVDGQGRLQAAAATAARAVGRGDEASGHAALRRAGAASVRVDRAPGLVCVSAGRGAGRGPFADLHVEGSACAVDEGTEARPR